MGIAKSEVHLNVLPSRERKSELNHLSYIDLAGRVNIIKLEIILPDGSFLTDTVNENLLLSIRKVTEVIQTQNKAKSVTVVSCLKLLVQWMFLKGIYRFSDLKVAHIYEFISESEKGVECLLQVKSRISNCLLQLSDDQLEDIRNQNIKTYFELARIPFSLRAKLPNLLKIIRAFKATGDLESVINSSSDREVKISTEVLRAKANAIRELWNQKADLSDYLIEDPYPGGVWKAFNNTSHLGGTTPTIPMELLPKLLGFSIEWILVIGPKVLQIERYLAETRKSTLIWPLEAHSMLKELNETISDYFSKSIQSNQIGVTANKIAFKTAKNYVLIACMVVIYMFTARRDVEVMSLKGNCILGKKYRRTLEIDIGKSNLRKEHIPCPEIVAKAIELVKEFKSISKKQFGDVIWPVNKKGKHKLAKSMDEFANFISAREYLINGKLELWHYSPHQFRRAFAILYVWRFEGPLLAIQHHLRHVGWSQTLTYIRSPEVFNLIYEEQFNLTVKKITDIAYGRVDKVAGIQSKLFEKQIDRIRQSINIVDPNSLEKKLVSWIRDRGLILKATPWGYCAANSYNSNLRRSACQSKANSFKSIDIVSNGPDPAGSSIELCSTCYFHFSDAGKEAHWRNELDSINKMLNIANDAEIIKSELIGKQSALTKFIDKYYEKAN